jgi:MerR family transcriptional regulator, light-induced transcriptional regulator
MDRTDERPHLRIGELSRRLGVSDHVLRAWESRYGLLRPVRTEGGFRLYSAADERRVRRMQALLAEGLSAAEAARVALGDEDGPVPAAGTIERLRAGLSRTLDAFDETGAQFVLDRVFADLSLPTALREVVLPYLADLGARWAAGTASVAQEHFASNVIRGRLSGLARGWGSGHGPGAVLACPPGELHDIALMSYGIVLNRNGWRIHYLGADTPVQDVLRTVRVTSPTLVVICATSAEPLRAARAELAVLARRASLALAGAGATARLAKSIGAQVLSDDPVTAAEQTARSA